MNSKRSRILSPKTYKQGAIVYWMSRDQRVFDNWALLYAQELAIQNKTDLAVVFCLRPSFEYNTKRLIEFMFAGLQEVEKHLEEKNIPYHFLIGDPITEIPKFVSKEKIGAMVTDFNPLRWKQEWNKKLSEKLPIPFYEVDAHNIVPAWIASPKQEFGAYTLRPKIHFHLQEYLESFPTLKKQQTSSLRSKQINWKEIRNQLTIDDSVPAIDWLKSGEKAADAMLEDFLENRLPIYNEARNDPTKYAQSQLSPYLHFGHIASQRVVLEVDRVKGYQASKEAFLEELIVRKELSDNYCLYNPNYNNSKGFPQWAKISHDKHGLDKRAFIYSRHELEEAQTHDPLWNAAQKEMLYKGKMHGYMRMYWAKKIFEWTKSPEDAQKYAIYLNDRYFLDGRDPNGYTGIAWSIGGVHDRAWFERAVFGKIRYMNYNGAKSKFDVKKYITSSEALV